MMIFWNIELCSHRRLYHATRERSNFGYLTVEMIHEWDLRVQSRLYPGESKTKMTSDAVINLMNPKTLSVAHIGQNLS
jgi:hypothetical protein